MNRRSFLKLIGVTPIAPSVLVVMPKKELTVAAAREFVGNTIPKRFTKEQWEVAKKSIDLTTVPNFVTRAYSTGSLYAGQMVEWTDSEKLIVRPVRFDEVYVK